MNIRFHYTLILFLLIGWMTLFSHDLWACSISCPEHPPKPPLPAEKLKKSSAVFLGMLIEKAERMQDKPCRKKSREDTTTELKRTMECPGELSPSQNDHIYTFEIEKAWKGVNDKTVSLYTPIDSGMCSGQGCPVEYTVLSQYSGPLELGGRYLVYTISFQGKGRLYPRETKLAKFAQVEMMFLDAPEKNISIPGMVKHLPQIFRNHSSIWTKAEAIKWLDLFPPQGTIEERKQFFLEALSQADEIFRREQEWARKFNKIQSESKYASKLKYRDINKEDPSYILQAIALALGNKDFKGDEDIKQALIYLLKGEEPRVQVAAARSLKRLNYNNEEIDRRVYDVLKKGLNNSDADIHNLSLITLVEIKTPQAKIIRLENSKKDLTENTSEEYKKLIDQMIERQKKALDKDP